MAGEGWLGVSGYLIRPECWQKGTAIMSNILSSWWFIISAAVVLVALCGLLFYLRKNREED